ncbi:hypothetical protein ACLB2K_042020 [Fragaria x ananassa]
MDAFENEKQPNKGVEDVAVNVPGFGSLTVTDVRTLTFETVDEAERFYYVYSTSVRFGCRKDDKGESNVYMVKIFVPEHNHELATGNQIAFVRAHRHFSDAALALTNTMTRVSIRPCHTYEYMVEQAGGFTMKDLYNKLDQQRHTSPFESDSEGMLSYMRALAAKDPHFICRFTTDLEDRKNNHRGSIIFGVALVSDETVETYTWLLRTFLESMNVKMPKAVLTDSDKAMRKAIETVMLEARHRLCIWHISKNALTHLKTEEKLKAFNRCMRKYQTVKEALVVSRYGTLTAKCKRLCFYASKTYAFHNLLHKEISRLLSIVEGFAKENEKVQAPAIPSNMKDNVVRDPIPVRTKGREKNDKKTEPPRRPITCGYCLSTGHNSKTCDVRKEKEKVEKINENDERNIDSHPSVATLAKRSCGYYK